MRADSFIKSTIDISNLQLNSAYSLETTSLRDVYFYL
jgi:hypothetical protein